jgi:hypothetical protein
MSRTLWLFGLSFLVWIPLVYIVIHRQSNEGNTNPYNPLRKHPLPEFVVSHVDRSNDAIVRAPASKSRVADDAAVPGSVAGPVSTSRASALTTEANLIPKLVKTPDIFRRSPVTAWKEFVELPLKKPATKDKFTVGNDIEMIQCSPAIERALLKPGLSQQDYTWCEWALSPGGGGVKVRAYHAALKSAKLTLDTAVVLLSSLCR